MNRGAAVIVLVIAAAGRAAEPPVPTPEEIEFFEARVRPLLVARCHACHGADDTPKGGLRLDSGEAVLRGGDSGPAVVAGDATASLLAAAIRWQGLEMPPDGRLPPEEVEILTRWIDAGAAWPAADRVVVPAAEPIDWDAARRGHWAWQPVRLPALPAVRDASWCTTPLDRFVRAGLEAAGLEPAPVAAPAILARRISFDLVGLPPTPERVTAFESAAAADIDAAIAGLVDELLASPRYGERWGRHWLDVARYSDGFGGFLDGAPLPHAWRYRDWVVAALNDDLPIDEFLRRQIAGDLLDPPTPVATGFFALGPTYISDGGDPDATAQAMGETLDDRVDTLTRGLLGLTVSCARCHDHKFDPVPQTDYYALAGVFHNTKVEERPLAAAPVVEAFREHAAAVQAIEARLKAAAELAAAEQREPNEAERAEHAADMQALERLKATAPAPYPVAHALADAGAADMPLAIRGNLRKPGAVVPRGFLTILAATPRPLTAGSGRLPLAAAVTAADNPLTARVFVNRIWRQHVGHGLVRTPSNFGVLGEPPTHPELLDWLAWEFVHEQGWSLKRLHRSILTSATYRMDSRVDPRAMAVDGDNRLVWRMNPRRLDVEAWRDGLLAVTGELDMTLGGPPVEQLLESPRRTLYGAVSRNGDRYAGDAFLRLFDFPLPRASSEGRLSSVVPQQALFLLNSPFMRARSRALAGRLAAESADDATRIERGYLLLYARSPFPHELAAGLAFLQAAAADAAGASAWEQYAQVLLAANEFMHVR